MQKDDSYYMSKVLRLAKRAQGKTSPNPMVGAIIVDRDGKIICGGYHKKAGEAHAEVVALDKVRGRELSEATMYINLEPCNYYGRTPPCLPQLIKAKLKRIVIAMQDPNPKVNGKSIAELRQAGIDVTVGVLQEEAKRLNEAYVTYMTYNRPFTILKLAITIDGKINGGQRISSHKSKSFVIKHIRDKVDAIIIGKNTAIVDNPQLQTSKSTKKVIISSNLSFPKFLDLFNDASNLIIATTDGSNPSFPFKEMGITIWTLPKDSNGGVSLGALWKRLYEDECTSVLVEGGAQLAKNLLQKNLVDRVYFFIAPKLGGDVGLNFPKIVLKNVKYRKIGEDLLIIGDVHRDN